MKVSEEKVEKLLKKLYIKTERLSEQTISLFSIAFRSFGEKTRNKSIEAKVYNKTTLILIYKSCCVGVICLLSEC